MVSTDEILKKYEKKLEAQISSSPTKNPDYSREYVQFRQEMIPEISGYEKWAKSIGSMIKMKASEKDRVKIQRYIDIAHLDITPSNAIALSAITLLGIFFITIMISVAVYIINPSSMGNILTFAFLGIITAMFVFYYTLSMPKRIANDWRLKTSSQMVPAILYMVVYMKHTSNLERAVEFAAEHLEGPLALDFKKVFYDVEVGKFSTIKASLENYLQGWRDYSPELIESFHLIESSLYEPLEARRIQILEKSLQVILDGVYEKMLKYSHSVRSPITSIYMLGIVLPTLALALLPLASTLLGNFLRWQHVMILFDIIIPFLVFYLSSEILLKRPGGYGEASVIESNPEYYKYKSKKPWVTAALIAIPIFIIALTPFIFQSSLFTSSLGLKSDYTFKEIGMSFLGDAKIFDFKTLDDGSTIGPFGPIGILFSLFIPLSIAVFFAVAYKKKTEDLIKSRDKTKVLEEEFTNSLFQLGNRLGDGVPAEIAFSRVAETTTGQVTQNFFSIVNQNIQALGMSVENAIFDKRRGAIIFFPSALIATSMRLLVESVKKGLQVAASSLMSISDYVKNIDKINERLRDLLAEVVSDMKSNMTFLAPLLSGIVVGLGVMITVILNKLSVINAQGAELTGMLATIPKLFDITQMIPPYYMQAIVGIYIIEIVFILTKTLVTVNSGKDPLKEKYEIAKNLKSAMLLYLVTTLLAVIALTALASVALGGITATG